MATQKLQLHKETLRTLAGSELPHIEGRGISIIYFSITICVSISKKPQNQ